MQVTFLNGLYKTHKGTLDTSEIAEHIRIGTHANLIFDCRDVLNLKGKVAYTEHKQKTLPCFTPSGRFSQGWGKNKYGDKIPVPPSKKHLIEYNGVVVLDYDGLEDKELDVLIEKIKACPYTFFSFRSPSNRGYKVLVKTTNRTPEQHANAFKTVGKYYKELTGIEDDKTSSNINRLCFVSVDIHMNYNEESSVFEIQPTLFKEQEKKAASTARVVLPPIENVEEYAVKAMNRVEKQGVYYVEGQRRNYLFKFIIESIKYGLSESECRNFIDNSLLSADCEANMVFKLVADLYQRVKPSEHGMYRRWAEENRPKKSTSNKPTGNSNKQESAPIIEEVYIPDLYQEEAKEECTVFIPEISEDELQTLDKKTRAAIYHQRLVEETLSKYFEFRINVLKQHEEYRQKGWKGFKKLDENAYNTIERRLRRHGVNCTSAKLNKIIRSDFSTEVNPLKEMFESWGKALGDDTTDYIGQVSALVETDAPDNLFARVFKKWLVASVANVFIEGHCTNHQCLILCGKQGTNKTTFFSNLFSHSEYSFTGHLNLKYNLRDSMLMLTDTFLVVLDEQFAVLDKEHQWEVLKSAITMPRVKERAIYGKTSDLLPRVANFCGTTNRIDILQDDTGNRRFFPFQLIKAIDINQMKRIDMTKMWGQAYKLFKSNWRYLLSPKENNEVNIYQQQFKKLGTEHHLILDLFEPCTYSKNGEVELYSSLELWKLLVSKYNLSKEVTPTKMGRVMAFLNFQQKTIKRPTDGRRGRYWVVKNLS